MRCPRALVSFIAAPPQPCPRYYLRNLTDEVRFRDWPVVEHLPLLQVGGGWCGGKGVGFCKWYCRCSPSRVKARGWRPAAEPAG